MGNLPASTSRKFNPADYKGAPEWFVSRFLSQLNLFTEPVYVALLNGLSFIQNFNAQYYTAVIVSGATPASNSFNFKSTIQGNPVEVVKAACNVASDLTIPITSAVEFSWYQSAGVVYVTAVTGLTAGTTYRLTLRVC